jgi:hypothetical protein
MLLLDTIVVDFLDNNANAIMYNLNLIIFYQEIANNT